MEQAALSPLSAWESFYVIVGSSAAALTGLQFVVVVLAADREFPQTTTTTRAFATPTIVHFCAVLLVSLLVSSPWHGLANAGVAIGACGVIGFIYGIVVIRHIRRQSGYVAVLEDWIWHVTLPLTAYAAFGAAGFALRRNPTTALFIIGAAAVLLLFSGIHNAWDAVTYIGTHRDHGSPANPQSDR